MSHTRWKILPHRRSSLISNSKSLLALLLLIACVTSAGAADPVKPVKDKKIVKEKNTEEKDDVPRANVRISGSSGDLEKNLTLNIPTQTPECSVPKEQVQIFLKSLKKRLLKASRAVGYYDAQFTPDMQYAKNCWQITVNVQPARPIRVTKADFKVLGEGLKEKEFQALANKPPYRNGEILNHQKYTDYKAQLKEVAQTLGYFDAAFEEHEIKVNPLKFTAAAKLTFNSGKRYRFGNITVEQTVLRPNVIKRFLQLKTGEVYSSDALILQQQLLQNTGYYADINIDAKHQQAVNYQIPVAITLKAKKRNAYVFKVGYGTDTGPRVSAELERRWMGGKGQQLNLQATAASKLSSFTARLTEPRANPKDDSLSYLFQWEQDVSDNITSRSLKLGAEYTRKVASDWQQTAFVTFLDDTTQVDLQSATKSQLTLVGARLEKTKADNLVFPLNGWRFKGEAQGAVNNLLSDQNVLRLSTETKGIKGFADGRIIGRLNLGTTLVGDLDTLPKSLRFFAGGGQSVRGYSFESLGEVNSDGIVVGGKHLLTGSIEYEQTIKDKWGAAVFVDAGNAFNDWSDPNLKVGVGAGVRWRSPIGPVRVDLGFPTDNFADPHLHLSIGSDL